MAREPVKTPQIELARRLSLERVFAAWPDSQNLVLGAHVAAEENSGSTSVFLTPTGRLWIQRRDPDSELPSSHKKKNTVGRFIPSQEHAQVAHVAGKSERGEKGSWEQRIDTGVQVSWAGSQVEIRKTSLEPHRDHLRYVVTVSMQTTARLGTLCAWSHSSEAWEGVSGWFIWIHGFYIRNCYLLLESWKVSRMRSKNGRGRQQRHQPSRGSLAASAACVPLGLLVTPFLTCYCPGLVTGTDMSQSYLAEVLAFDPF